MELVVHLADDVRSFTIRTVQQASLVLEAILAAIKAAYGALEDLVLNALKWIRWAFGWQDIRRTSAFLEARFVEALDLVADSVDDARPVIEDFFDDVAASIEAKFNALQETIGADGSLDGMVGREGGLEDDTHAEAHEEHSVHAEYLMRRTPSTDEHVRVDDRGALARMQANATSVGELVQGVLRELDLGELERAWEEARERFLQVRDVGSLANASLVTLLEALKQAIRIVLVSLKKILSALMEMAADVLRAGRDALKAPIYVPFISEIAGAKGIQLSILGLLSLQVGFFTTVLHKAMTGAPPIPRSMDPDGIAPTEPFDLDEGASSELLPLLYTVRAVAWTWKYMATASLATTTRPPATAWTRNVPWSVRIPMGIEMLASASTLLYELIWLRSDGRCHAPSIIIAGCSFVVSSSVSVITLGKKSDLHRLKMYEATAAELCAGALDVVSAILFVLETEDMKDPRDRGPRRAKLFLVAGPRMLWMAALNANVTPGLSGALGGIGAMMYAAGTVASTQLEVEP